MEQQTLFYKASQLDNIWMKWVSIFICDFEKTEMFESLTLGAVLNPYEHPAGCHISLALGAKEDEKIASS